MGKNNVRQLRESQLMSKAELARKAGISPLTIDRIERGENCRMDTKRKIILALGFTLGDKHKVFAGDDEVRIKKKSKDLQTGNS
ncbi:MAG: helix-turn-helix transcriptional regulator [bacterium]